VKSKSFTDKILKKGLCRGTLRLGQSTGENNGKRGGSSKTGPTNWTREEKATDHPITDGFTKRGEDLRRDQEESKTF